MEKSTKIWLVISGVLLVALGIMCIANPEATLFATAWLIGCFTLLSGISRLVFTFRTERFMPNSGTRVLTGVFDVLFGIFMLCNNVFVAVSLPLIFAIWLIVEGIILAVQSFDYKKADFQGWWGLLLMGIAVIVLGFFAMKNLEVTGMTMSIMFGCAVTLLGIAYIVAFFGINKFQRKVKQAKEAFRESIDYKG